MLNVKDVTDVDAFRAVELGSTIIWSLFFILRRHGGLVLLLLSHHFQSFWI